jgi:hypothetical protein
MPNTALNRTVVALLTNKSGGALAYGDVVVIDSANASAFTTTTTGGLSTQQIGIIIEPNGIANNALGMVATGGWVPKVNLNAAATIGQFLKTHTVAGQATPHSSPQVEGDFGVALDASATPTAILFGSPNGPLSAAGGTVDRSMVQGRLTLETGVPVSTTDQVDKTTLYWTPYLGNQMALYDGAAWAVVEFGELSLALTGLTANKNYDVFIDYNGGTPQIVLGTAWTNDTTRAEALTTQNAVYVKTGAADHRYVGTIRTTDTDKTQDTLAKRFVWNLYNRVPRTMQAATETTDTWTYTTATWRQANANAANQLDYVVGLNDMAVEATALGMPSNSGSSATSTAIGVDSTSTPGSLLMPTSGHTGQIPVAATYIGTPGIGRHFLAWLEYSSASGTSTWRGDSGAPTRLQAGIIGRLWN